MDQEEYDMKYVPPRILKSVQGYLKDGDSVHTAVYPVNIPDDMLLRVLQHHGSKPLDDLIHEIFRVGLRIWAENLFVDVFGSIRHLETFIEEMKHRNLKKARSEEE